MKGVIAPLSCRPLAIGYEFFNKTAKNAVNMPAHSKTIDSLKRGPPSWTNAHWGLSGV